VKASFSYYRRETGRTPGVKQSGAFHVEYGVHHSAMLGFRVRPASECASMSHFDVLQRASLRRKLETLAGYDTSQTGRMVCQ
jgi:hypothetical protein